MNLKERSLKARESKKTPLDFILQGEDIIFREYGACEIGMWPIPRVLNYLDFIGKRYEEEYRRSKMKTRGKK